MDNQIPSCTQRLHRTPNLKLPCWCHEGPHVHQQEATVTLVQWLQPGQCGQARAGLGS